MDAYQECLDFLSYTMQSYLEGNEESLKLFDAAAYIAANVRAMLDVQEK